MDEYRPAVAVICRDRPSPSASTDSVTKSSSPSPMMTSVTAEPGFSRRRNARLPRRWAQLLGSRRRLTAEAVSLPEALSASNSNFPSPK